WKLLATLHTPQTPQLHRKITTPIYDSLCPVADVCTTATKNDSHVPGREVMRHDHLVNVSCSCSPRESGRGNQCRESNGKLALNAMMPAMLTPRLANPTSA